MYNSLTREEEGLALVDNLVLHRLAAALVQPHLDVADLLVQLREELEPGSPLDQDLRLFVVSRATLAFQNEYGELYFGKEAKTMR